MEEPVTIILIAKSLCSASTSFTAMTEAIDQNIACALATTILASTNNRNEVAIPLSICPKANTDKVINRTGRNEYLEIDIMSGNDRIMTDHEYTVIMMPAVDSEIENALAIEVNKPIGMNSDVLNINAASAIPINGNSCFVDNLFITLLNKYVDYFTTLIEKVILNTWKNSQL